VACKHKHHEGGKSLPDLTGTVLTHTKGVVVEANKVRKAKATCI